MIAFQLTKAGIAADETIEALASEAPACALAPARDNAGGKARQVGVRINHRGWPSPSSSAGSRVILYLGHT